MEARIVFRNTVIVLATVAAAFILVSSIRILIVTLLAVIIASAARPAVRRLERIGLPSAAAILLVYGGILIGIGALLLLIVPPVVNQLANFLSNENLLAVRLQVVVNWLENTLSSITGSPVTLINAADLSSAAESIVTQVRDIAPEFVDDLGGVVGEIVLIFVMGVYWLTSRDKIADFIENILALRSRYKANQIILEVETAVGSYVRGVIAVALIVGALNFIVLLILNVPNAATYSFIIGVMTMLPVVGGFIGGGGATLLAALSSPVHGALVFIVFVLVQQLETHYLTPRVMARSMRIDPLLVIIGILAGFTLYGVIGGIIAVPIIGTITILLRTLVIEPQVEKVANKIEGGAVILNTGESVETDETTPGGLVIGR